MVDFPQRLKMLREETELLQKELAVKLDISRATLASWESGNRTPELGAAEKLANFFDVSIDYLLGRTNERKPGAGVLPIDDPEVRKLMETVTAEFRMAPDVPEKAKQEILREMANYFKYKLEQEKQK